MNATVNRVSLTNAAKLAAAAADSKSTIDLLASCLLRFGEVGLVVAATDLTTTVATVVAGDARKGDRWEVCVDAKRFSAAVASLPGADVTVSVDDKRRITLKSAKATVTLAGRPGEDFPEVHQAPAGWEVSASGLAGAIGRAAYVRGLDEMQFPGPYLFAKGGRCSMIAVTSHRFAMSEFAAPNVRDFDEVVVPVKGLDRIASALEGVETAVLAIGGGRLFVTAGAVSVSVKLSDAKVVPWRTIIRTYIDDGKRSAVSLNREELLAAARRAGMMAGTSEKLANGVNMTIEGGALTVASALDGMGDASTVLDLSADGPRGAVRASWRYMADALLALDADAIEFNYGGTREPIMLRVPGSPEFHLIMVQDLGSAA